MLMYDRPARTPQGQELGVRTARTHNQKVHAIHVMATASLSNSPPTDRIRPAGMIAMIPAATTPVLALCVISYARRPVKSAASDPNHGGIMQQMSLTLMGA